MSAREPSPAPEEPRGPSRRAVIRGGAAAMLSAPAILSGSCASTGREGARGAAAFESSRVTPGDPRYASLRYGFNQRFEGDPAYIVVARSTADVLEAVRRALAEDQRITVRGGGHCYENFVSSNPGGVIVDLSGLSGVYRWP